MLKNYTALAVEEAARRRAQRDEQEIQEIENQLREADERVARHAALQAKHGLPDHATPRQISDAEREYAAAWGSFVISMFGGGARASHVLDPDNSGFADPAMIAALHEQRAKLRAEFEASWPPADLAARTAPAVTDGVKTLFGHAVGRAA